MSASFSNGGQRKIGMILKIQVQALWYTLKQKERVSQTPMHLLLCLLFTFAFLRRTENHNLDLHISDQLLLTVHVCTLTHCNKARNDHWQSLTLSFTAPYCLLRKGALYY